MPRKSADDVEFLPDDVAAGDADIDMTPDVEEEFDAGSLRVNFSQQEADSEARSYDAVPTGMYKCDIVKVEVKKCGPTSNNPGKPYYSLWLKVTDDIIAQKKYAGTHFFGSVMLFEGALYSLSQLHKALGWPMDGSVIPPEQIVDRQVLVSVTRQKDKYAMDRSGDPNTMIWKNEVKGYKSAGSTKLGPANQSDSLLPS